MDLINAEKISSVATGFSKLSLWQQIMMLLALSASVALGVFVVLWAKEPNLLPMYAHVDSVEVPKVIDALESNKIKYKFKERRINQKYRQSYRLF